MPVMQRSSDGARKKGRNGFEFPGFRDEFENLWKWREKDQSGFLVGK